MKARRTSRGHVARGAIALALALGTSMALAASATALSASPAAPTKACGSVVLSGSKWLGGNGVSVRSNGVDEGTFTSCGTALSVVNGVVAGSEWQCVELVNRLYLDRGWIGTTWSGSAGSAFWKATPAGLKKATQGSVSYLGAGDVVDIAVLHHGVVLGGHVFIVDTARRTTSGTVTLVSQNNSGVARKPGSISKSVVTVSGSGGGWTYRVIGVIHAP